MNRKKNMYMCYKPGKSMYLLLRRNILISAITCYDGKCYTIVQSQPQNLGDVLIIFEHYKYIDSLAMHYHEVKFDLSLTYFDLINIDESCISNYLLLLPELGRKDTFMIRNILLTTQLI